jgi:arginine/ornithine N-succinyltransferase beta subunit
MIKDEIDADELTEVKVDDEQASTLKVLMEIQKKVRELEENEKNLRSELEASKVELKKKKIAEETQKVFVINSKEKENEVEGFWATICRIGKGILGGILSFLGIKI